jgi:hypothetical protein
MPFIEAEQAPNVCANRGRRPRLPERGERNESLAPTATLTGVTGHCRSVRANPVADPAAYGHVPVEDGITGG